MFSPYWDLLIRRNDKLDHVVQQEENTHVDLKLLPNEQAPGTLFQLKQKKAFSHCSWTKGSRNLHWKSKKCSFTNPPQPQETRHLTSDVLPLSSPITPELSAERASTKPHWDYVDLHHEEFRHKDSKVVSPGLAPCANWRLNVGREGAPQLVPQEPTMEPSTLRSAPPASSNAFFNAEAEWHFGLS